MNTISIYIHRSLGLPTVAERRLAEVIPTAEPTTIHWGIFQLFILLQLLDLITTFIAFSLHGREANPIVASLFPALGAYVGVSAAKGVLVLVALVAVRVGRHRAVRMANVAYTALILWNLLVISRLGGSI